MSAKGPPEGAAMRYSQGDLAILSAEIYTPGLSSSSTWPAGTKKTLPPVRASEDAPRKRAKVQAPEDAAEREDEEKKRARGRPRLDVKDETAADRRRTQIRLAQRAYRNRKENAIQSLEKKVQDLKDTNEEMSNVFMQLHDFVVSTGALDRNPEFGRQLRLTTEKFLSLARKASEDGDKDDEAGNASADDHGDHSSSTQVDHAKSSSPEHPNGSWSGPEAVKPRAQPLLYGGFTITHEPLNEHDIMAEFSSNLMPLPTTSGLDFEDITQPTLENASFPFGTAPDFDFSSFPGPSPYSSLPLPKTYTSQEITFGRRLHRFASERALLLISMPNPPMERFNRVFGFCLLVESRDAIHARLRKIVGRSIQENLSNWQYPFYNLGGAGTHFDAGGMGMERVGNHGTVDVLKPQNTGGFSTGPFTPDISEVQDSALDKDMRMAMPGFRGDYFDCDEVEIYLRQRGVTIPPGADHVTVEVDLAGLGANSMSGETFISTADNANNHSNHSGQNNNSNHNNLFAHPLNNGVNSSSDSSASSTDGGTGSATTASTQAPPGAGWPLGTAGALVDPLLSGVFSQATGGSYVAMGTATSSAPEFRVTSDGSGHSNPLLAFAPPPQSTMQRREMVTVDVNTLITAMTERATCLGRTPGFRLADINTAFWKAARVING